MASKVSLPLIDSRTPDDIAGQTRELLVKYLNSYGWKPHDESGEAEDALVGVFAHYCGLIVDRINRAPEKNFLAFLDLLGNSPVPAMPAQVPVTFFLDSAATDGFSIPAGTGIQSAPGEGMAVPLVFETERDFWLTNFELQAMGKISMNGLFTDIPLIKSLQTKAGNIQAAEPVFGQATATYYFGLQLAATRTLAVNRPVPLYFFINNPEYSPVTARVASGAAPRLVWEYSTISVKDATPQWLPLLVEDQTEGLTRTGSVEFLVPADFKKLTIVSELFWVRVHLDSMTATYNPAPRLNGVALNTVIAYQTVSVNNEVLGSSSGNAGQTFNTFKKPILPGERLEVRELRSAATGLPASQITSEDWTPWEEVTDFYRSGPLDRHYMVDRQVGEIRFGNGLNGMIPPSGTRNVRMALYRTTSGAAGNVSADTVKTLMAGIKHIDKVTNFAAAAGGADVETKDSLLDRAPRALRHRDRAVAAEDYEDLAMLASSDVARALCVPLIDLASEPVGVVDTLAEVAAGGGKVSIIIVPRTLAPKPLPSQILMSRVADHLRQRSTATTLVSVVGPLYLRVKIEVNLKLDSLHSEDRVKRELQEIFAAFLHPLTGRYGQGWPFGRKPHESDIHRLIGTVAGVDHVTSLKISLAADENPFGCDSDVVGCIEKTGRFLIYSDQHEIFTSI